VGNCIVGGSKGQLHRLDLGRVDDLFAAVAQLCAKKRIAAGQFRVTEIDRYQVDGLQAVSGGGAVTSAERA
jgi:hypothetical protein